MITQEEKQARMAVIRDRLADRNISEVARRLKYTSVWLRSILKPDSTHSPSERIICALEDYLEIKRNNKWHDQEI